MSTPDDSDPGWANYRRSKTPEGQAWQANRVAGMRKALHAAGYETSLHPLGAQFHTFTVPLPSGHHVRVAAPVAGVGSTVLSLHPDATARGEGIDIGAAGTQQATTIRSWENTGGDDAHVVQHVRRFLRDPGVQRVIGKR